MTLATRVYETSQVPTFDVFINGVRQVGNIVSMRSGAMSFDSPVPTVDIEFTTLPAFIRRGMPVTIDFGYSGEQARLFTGGVLSLPGEDPEFFRSQCFYRGATDATGAQIAATASLIGGPSVWPPIPSGQYIDFAQDNHLVWDTATAGAEAARLLTLQARIPRRPAGKLLSATIHCVGDLYGAFRSYRIPAQDFSGQTIKTAIGAVLTAAGIAAYNTAGVPAYTLASSGAILERMPGAQKLAKLMIMGCHVQQLKSGLVLVQVTKFQPAPVANYTYSNTTQAFARIMDTTGEMRVPLNPLLEIGQTGQIDIDYLAVNGRYFLFGHRWEIGKSGCWSYLDQRGGDEFGGTVNINPIADFTYSVEIEPIGDRLWAIVSFDASISFDPDGTIASYAWSDDQVSTPEIATITTSHPTVRYDITAMTTVNVTVTVTDNSGLTGAVTKAVALTAASTAVKLPAVGLAAGTNSAVSPDGGQTWNTTAAGTVNCIAMRPADGVNFGHVIKGFADGHIERSTDSGKTWASVLAAVGSAFNYLAWDWRNGNVTWGLTADMRLYISVDAGITWVVYDALRTRLSLAGAIGGRRAIGLPAAGGVYVGGGDGAGHPLIAFDPVVGSHGWVQVALTGDIATDTATPADATMRIVDYTAPGNGVEVMILEWASGGGGSLVAIYSTTSPPGATKAFTRATGLTAGLKTGRCVVGDAAVAGTTFHAMFNDRDVWSSTDGSAWSKTANVLPVGFAFNDAIFLSDVLTGLPVFQGVYMTASEDSTGTGLVSKSTDGLLTLNAVYPATGFPAWVAGAKAKMLSIGAPGASVAGSGQLAIINANARIDTYTAGHWSTQKVSSSLSAGKLLHVGSHWFFVVNRGNAGEAYHSADGITFTKTLAKTTSGGLDSGVCDIDVGPDGTIWAVYSDPTGSASGQNAFTPLLIKKCVAPYTSWTTAYTDPGWSTNFNTRGYTIAAHQQDPTKITAICGGAGAEPDSIYTVDGGANWTVNTSNGPSRSNGVVADTCRYGASGRLFYLKATSTWTLEYTDDDGHGAAWTTPSFSPAIAAGSGRELWWWQSTGFNGGLILADQTSKVCIYKTIDNGLNWTRVIDGSDAVLNYQGGAITYDPATDTAYVAKLGATEKIGKIAGMISGAAVTSDVTGDYVTGASLNGWCLAMPR